MASNDFFSGLDFSYTANLASSVQKQIDESNGRNMEIAQEAYENRQRMQEALERTANNTAETNIQLEKVVANQNDYIDLLKKQLLIQEEQLGTLKSIFASEDNAVEFEEEILKLIREQIDSQHPLWDYVKDKGGDIAVAGITAGAPVLYTAVKAFLASKGIMF